MAATSAVVIWYLTRFLETRQNVREKGTVHICGGFCGGFSSALPEVAFFLIAWLGTYQLRWPAQRTNRVVSQILVFTPLTIPYLLHSFV